MTLMSSYPALKEDFVAFDPRINLKMLHEFSIQSRALPKAPFIFSKATNSTLKGIREKDDE